MLPETDRAMSQRFAIAEPLAVRQVLDDLRAARVLIALYTPGHVDAFVPARLLSREATALRFEVPDDAHRCASVPGRNLLIAVAVLDRVRIQFDVRAPRLLRERALPELHCALPHAVVRIQRREAFRVRPPALHPVLAVLREPPNGERRYRVEDISATGVALAMRCIDEPPTPGDLWRHCRLEIPGLPPIPCDLEARTLVQLGHGEFRLGCVFHHPVPDSLRALQRYVMDVERGRAPMAPPITPACS